MALIEADGIHVRFGDRVVLEEINLSVNEGELHGIMGPNGAGKTTFFNTLTGSVKPSRGRIRLDGSDIAGLDPHAIARKGVARSFQIMTLFNDFTAQENVMVALPAFRARGFDVRRAVAGDTALADEANAVLASVGLGAKAAISAKLRRITVPPGSVQTRAGSSGRSSAQRPMTSRVKLNEAGRSARSSIFTLPR